jgi:acyl-coenzyme A thioesterase PaaI-like protein
MLAALVDTAAGQALRTTLKSGHDAVTVHLDATYFLPIATDRVFAEGSVVRKGRNLAHIDVAVVNEGGALVARGWCVLKLLRRPEAARPENCLPAPATPVPPPVRCESHEGGMGI